MSNSLKDNTDKEIITELIQGMNNPDKLNLLFINKGSKGKHFDLGMGYYVLDQALHSENIYLKCKFYYFNKKIV